MAKKYKFYEPVPKIDYNAHIELKVERFYDEINELLTEAENEVDMLVDYNVDLVIENMAKVNKLVEQIEAIEEVDYEAFEERYAALDNWVFDMVCGWAPDEDVLGYM